MPPRLPPLLHAWIGNQIAHSPLNLAPCRGREQAVAMGEIHCFEVVHEQVEESAKPELRDRIEIGKTLYAAKKNCAQLGTIEQSVCQLAPLHGQSINGRLSSFPGLLADLHGQVNERRDSDKHSS